MSAIMLTTPFSSGGPVRFSFFGERLVVSSGLMGRTTSRRGEVGTRITPRLWPARAAAAPGPTRSKVSGMLKRIPISTLRKVHLYLSCTCAPLLLFFIVSGCWQSFMLHRRPKDNSYRPPVVVSILSRVHTNQGLPPGSEESIRPTAFRVLVLLAAAGLILTISLGVLMAFRVTPRSWPVWMCLASGAIIPLLILLLERAFR